MSYLTAAMVLSPNLEAENSWEIQAGLAGFNPSKKNIVANLHFTCGIEVFAKMLTVSKHHQTSLNTSKATARLMPGEPDVPNRARTNEARSGQDLTHGDQAWGQLP